jgi:CMP-N-acetylneuraminate monooxygenase
MKRLGIFETKSESVNAVIDINNLNIGINSIKNHFVVLNEEKQVIQVVDKICDHAGGKLILKGDYAVCPMHGWSLDLRTMKYQDSHTVKKGVDYFIDNGKLVIPYEECFLVNPFKSDLSETEVKFRFLNHAAISITYKEITLVTDPWLFGPAFMTGWWLDHPSAEDSIEILKNADFVFISHNHPDHLHSETLELVDKDKKFIVGDFNSKSTEKYLKSLGFNNVDSFQFGVIYQIKENFQFSIFKSGDFRDDSGLYLNIGGIEILITVDANILNSLKLPRNIDLLLTSFAGGASGFPLCFENYNLIQKSSVIERNKSAIKASVAAYLRTTMPKFYMPYAGMFKEKADRDSFIRENNSKNSVYDYKKMVNHFGSNFVDPKRNLCYTLTKSSLIPKEINVSFLPDDDIDFYLDRYKNSFKYESDFIIKYMSNSGYHAKQLLYILPVDDDFTKVVNDIIFCNFDTQEFKVVLESDIVLEVPDFRVMKLYVRQEIFASVVLNRLPWEDFSIGFQMRILRSPNSYESEFWYHFTNVYIDPVNYKSSVNCGSCNLINQNPQLI